MFLAISLYANRYNNYNISTFLVKVLNLVHVVFACFALYTRRFDELVHVLSPVSIQTQSVALHALRALRLDEQPIGCSVEAVATMIGCLPTHSLAFSPVSIQTQRTQRNRLRLDGNRA